MSMMEMVFFSPHDSFDRQVWPKMCPQFFSYTIFIKNHSLLLRQKATSNTKHWLQSAWPFCTGLKVLTIHGRLNTKITTEIIYSCIRHSQCIHQGLLKQEENGMPRECPLLDSGCVAVFKIMIFFFFFFFLTSDYAFHSLGFFYCKSKKPREWNAWYGFLVWKMGMRKVLTSYDCCES